MGFMDVMFGKKPEIQTKTIHDPRKRAVASPLSKYLESQVGEGVPRYGKQILSDVPEEGMNRASEFLGMDTESFFEERVKGPAMQTFREDLLPLVREEFAGSLSGSGRFRTEEESASRFARGLAETRAGLEMALPQAQWKMAREMKVEADKEYAMQYQDWMKSLPQFNPALGEAMKFLQDSTNTGDTVLSYLDEGSEGIFGDVLKAAAMIFTGIQTGSSLGNGSSTGGSIGIGGGSPDPTSFGGAPLMI